MRYGRIGPLARALILLPRLASCELLLYWQFPQLGMLLRTKDKQSEPHRLPLALKVLHCRMLLYFGRHHLRRPPQLQSPVNHSMICLQLGTGVAFTPGANR